MFLCSIASNRKRIQNVRDEIYGTSLLYSVQQLVWSIQRIMNRVLHDNVFHNMVDPRDQRMNHFEMVDGNPEMKKQQQKLEVYDEKYYQNMCQYYSESERFCFCSGFPLILMVEMKYAKHVHRVVFNVAKVNVNFILYLKQKKNENQIKLLNIDITFEPKIV